jgi:outer membrane protein assembly factor BamB
MVKLSLRGAVLLGVLFVFGYGTSISAKEPAFAKATAGGNDLLSPVSGELLKAANLELVWSNRVPMRKGETLKQLFIAGDRIYSLSSGNYIAALNRQKGTIVFSRELSPAGLPVVGWELYNDELFSIVGDELVEIEPQSGKELSVNRLESGAACAAARNRGYFYIGGTDKRIHALRASDKVRLFRVSAENDSGIVSLIADEHFVVFATDRGNVVSFTADGPKQLWQFYAAEAIVGPIARDANSLFVASKDTNVYRLDIGTGKLIWKYQTAAVLDKGPVVSGLVVYQYVREKGLAAIDKENGKALWQLAGGASLLTEADGKAYVITDKRTLVVMDNKKGTQLYSVNFAGVSRYITNTQDSKMYVADEDGRVACIRPIKDR